MSENAERLVVFPERVPANIGLSAITWARKNLFSSWLSSLITIMLVVLLTWSLSIFLNWAVITAVWTAPSGQYCRGHGACWALIHEKYRYIFFGSFPYEEQWRPLLAVITMLTMLILSADRRMWNVRLVAIWGCGTLITFVLMLGEIDVGAGGLFFTIMTIGIGGALARGTTGSRLEMLIWKILTGIGATGIALRILGVFPAIKLQIGLFSYVETNSWGGLPVTMILATYGLLIAFPFGILLALGRRSRLPMIRALCITFIELIRGVPLISLLLMASVMLPLFLPSGSMIDKFLRAQVAIILFAGAYIAEVIRGGLQSLQRGQYEAADALGLNYAQKTTLVILPQAVRVVIPPLINTFISFFKDTSLVLIIGILDFLNTANQVLIDPYWAGYPGEVYLFAAFVYFCFCFSMSRYSRYLELEFNKGSRR